jgi:ABC-type dipeptide/oligopeptide/nickel transport system permease component
VLKFILHRALATVPVLFLLSLIVFSLIHLIPGDPVQIMLGEENDPHALQALRRELGLDHPIVEQFLRWLWRLLQGDFGRSLRSHQPVLEAIGERLPVTIELTVLTIFALPGLGRLVVDSIFARDFPIVQGVILFLALTRITCNFVVDVAYALLDPRIRYD